MESLQNDKVNKEDTILQSQDQISTANIETKIERGSPHSQYGTCARFVSKQTKVTNL